jgi:hypothetical protein
VAIGALHKSGFKISEKKSQTEKPKKTHAFILMDIKRHEGMRAVVLQDYKIFL